MECRVRSVECRARNATRLKCCACHAKWRWRSPKCCAFHDNCDSSCENDTKVLCLPHKTTFDTLSNRLECHKVPHLQRKTASQPAWKPSKRRGFSFPLRHGEATGKPETRDETRWSIKTSISCETSSNFHSL